MRVVAGTAKGRRLKGTLSPETRPTTERVRAAIFNILGPEQYEDHRVLDLYAGSGSLGIEALSMGAGWADFVERNQRQCQVVQANLDSTGFQRAARVYCNTVEAALATLPGGYRLVLMDPPYKLTSLDGALEAIATTAGLLEPGGTVVVGHSKRLSLKQDYEPLEMVSQRRYGDNAVDFYRHEGRLI
jgi:16S rRNA (guanine966-N2)-methyltransferase